MDFDSYKAETLLIGWAFINLYAWANSFHWFVLAILTIQVIITFIATIIITIKQHGIKKRSAKKARGPRGGNN
jgi:phosphatidylglycerophosphate synthase